MKAYSLFRYKDFISEQTEEAKELVNQVTANAIWKYINEEVPFAIFPLYNTRTGKWLDEQKASDIGLYLTQIDLDFTLFEVEIICGLLPDQTKNSNRYLFIQNVEEGQAKSIAGQFDLDQIVCGNGFRAYSVDLLGDRKQLMLNSGDMQMAWVGALLGPVKPWV